MPESLFPKFEHMLEEIFAEDESKIKALQEFMSQNLCTQPEAQRYYRVEISRKYKQGRVFDIYAEPEAVQLIEAAADKLGYLIQIHDLSEFLSRPPIAACSGQR